MTSLGICSTYIFTMNLYETDTVIHVCDTQPFFVAYSLA